MKLAPMDVSSSGIPPDVVDWGCSRARRPICWNRDTVDAIGELRNRLAEDIAVRKSAHAVIGLLAQILGDVIRPPCTNCHYGRGDWRECVTMPRHLTQGACANCVRGGIAMSCSLRWLAGLPWYPRELPKISPTIYFSSFRFGGGCKGGM